METDIMAEKVSSKLVNADISAINQKVQTIDYEIKIIECKLLLLEDVLMNLKNYWKGKAADAFFAGIYDDIEKFRTIQKSIYEMKENLNFAAKTYYGCEEKALEVLNAISL